MNWGLALITSSIAIAQDWYGPVGPWCWIQRSDLWWALWYANCADCALEASKDAWPGGRYAPLFLAFALNIVTFAIVAWRANHVTVDVKAGQVSRISIGARCDCVRTRLQSNTISSRVSVRTGVCSAAAVASSSSHFWPRGYRLRCSGLVRLNRSL